MVATAEFQKSNVKMATNYARHSSVINKAWSSDKIPMFQTTKISPTTGNTYVQRTRLINSKAYKIAVSGACAAVAGELEIDMKHLGIEFNPDSKTRPWAVGLSRGAAFMFEQFLATIVQQIVAQNKIIRSGIKKHARNHKEVTKLAIAEVRKSIFEAASGVPTSTTALPMMVARKKKDGEVEAVGEKEFVAAPAAADEDVDEEENDDEA